MFVHSSLEAQPLEGYFSIKRNNNKIRGGSLINTMFLLYCCYLLFIFMVSFFFIEGFVFN